MISTLYMRTIILAVMVVSPALGSAGENSTPVDFELQQLHGDMIRLSDYRGKWVVLNYWATWCAPCRKEIPELSELHNERDDIIVLGLAFEDTDPESFDEFLEELKPSYPSLLVDVYEPPQPFGAPRVLPTTIILDPQGYAVKTYMGPVTKKDLESFVDAE